MKYKRLLSAALLVAIVSITVYLIIIMMGSAMIDEKKLVFQSTSRIVDEQGNEIAKLYEQNRDIVKIEKIPSHVQQAFIATEDARFYEHHGIDVYSIFRAFYKNVLAGEKVQGGSTITQQLAKNVFLSNEKTVARKVKEMMISLNLERRYTKAQLLEMYLNHVYFGHGAYGIEAAAQFYFNKSVPDLRVEEGALLAALLKAPGAYSPILYPDKSKTRRDLVLSLMNEYGYLSAEEAVRYQGKTLGLNVQHDTQKQAFQTYIDMVLQEAEDVYHLSYEEVLRGGYTCTVYMNAAVQEEAFRAFQNARNFPKDDVEGAFVLMDAKTGGVRAAIGGRTYVPRGWNRVMAKRQPGSVMKPILVYAPALETKRYTPYSLLSNRKQSFQGYTPRNFNERYSDHITMYDAIVHSANVPAVWMLDQIGIETAKRYMKQAGVPLQDAGLSAALGGLKEGLSPLELTKVYRSFAANGRIIEPHVIKQMTNQKGEVVASASKQETPLFSSQTAWYMTRMLTAVVKEGTARAGTYGGDLAGKTGTTSLPGQQTGARDAWFVGYTPALVGAVWMGYDRTDDKHYLKGGSSYPTKLFKSILIASDAVNAGKFIKPKGVRDIEAPIRLGEVRNVQAKLTFNPLGLFTAKVTWTPLSDKRVQYHVYKMEGGVSSHIGTVTGGSAYDVKFINIFAKPQFYVVPYNSQTNQQGGKSNAASL